MTLLTAGDGETDLSNTTISVTGATAIKLYNAAAYNATDDRTVNVTLSTDDGDRLDLQLTIKGVESKMLVLDVPVYTNITLTPGVEYRATSDPATITNRNPYPISVSLTNIQPGEDSPKLVKSVPTDETGLLELMNAGVKVGVEIGENSHYYDPDAGASITIADILGAEAQQQFNYIMEFSPLYTGVRKEDVTYTISYLFAISAHDVATGG